MNRDNVGMSSGSAPDYGTTASAVLVVWSPSSSYGVECRLKGCDRTSSVSKCSSVVVVVVVLSSLPCVVDVVASDSDRDKTMRTETENAKNRNYTHVETLSPESRQVVTLSTPSSSSS